MILCKIVSVTMNRAHLNYFSRARTTDTPACPAFAEAASRRQAKRLTVNRFVGCAGLPKVLSRMCTHFGVQARDTG
jgi:hypothetical protein